MKSADITLLLEGTYPFVRGGVSSWVHDLIQGLSQYSFTLIFLGSTKDKYAEACYELPDNVVSLQTHYIFETEELKPDKPNVNHLRCFQHVDRVHDYLANIEQGIDENDIKGLFSCLCNNGSVHETLDAQQFYFSKPSWQRICDRYNQNAADSSFIDYFWTVRSTHAAIFKLASFAQQVPQSLVLHAISTGYAGFLGALLKNRDGCPFLLTEHGIYTKERKIDLLSAYVQDNNGYFSEASITGMSYHHQLWIRFFEGIGRLVYTSTDPIISLYERNRQRQIKDGADPERTLVIPNGVDPVRFVSILANRPQQVPMVLGLIGRIVPIKDIKTFIRAMRTICSVIPEAQGWLIGPDDEDPEYAEQCKELVESLQLQEHVKFLGFQNIADILPQLGLLVLTSISEAFPLVIVEAYAAGLPVITTDVGGCREIIEGSEPEDRQLGSAGAVVPIASPEETAKAAIELLTDSNRWLKAQQAGLQRVKKYYTRDRVMQSYDQLYGNALRNGN